MAWKIVRAVGIAVLAMLAAAALFFAAVAMFSAPAEAAELPRAAQEYRRQLTREARAVWGMNAPVPVFAAQIHQESAWRTDAVSRVGARSLSQFMPSTAKWIHEAYSEQLGALEVYSPEWAIRAMVLYDRHLWDRTVLAADDCERMAFTLGQYNGGERWMLKRRALAEDPSFCLDAACDINPGIKVSNQRENREYPRRILLWHQPLYASWGKTLCI